MLKHRLLGPLQTFWFHRPRVISIKKGVVPWFPKWFWCCWFRDQTWGITTLRPSFPNLLHFPCMFVASIISWTLAPELQNFMGKKILKPICLALCKLILIEISSFSLLLYNLFLFFYYIRYNSSGTSLENIYLPLEFTHEFILLLRYSTATC